MSNGSPLVTLLGRKAPIKLLGQVPREMYDPQRQTLSAEAYQQFGAYLGGSSSTSFDGKTGREGDE